MEEREDFLRGKRIALVTNIARPYRIPLYENLNRRIAAQGGEFKVFFYSDVSQHARRRNTGEAVEGQYPQLLVAGLEIPLNYEKVLSVPVRLPGALRSYRPDILISGAFGLVGTAGWLYSRSRRIPYVQWSGATTVRQSRNTRLGNAGQRFPRRSCRCLHFLWQCRLKLSDRPGRRAAPRSHRGQRGGRRLLRRAGRAVPWSHRRTEGHRRLDRRQSALCRWPAGAQRG